MKWIFLPSADFAGIDAFSVVPARTQSKMNENKIQSKMEMRSMLHND